MTGHASNIYDLNWLGGPTPSEPLIRIEVRALTVPFFFHFTSYAPWCKMRRSKQGPDCYRVSDSSSVTHCGEGHGFTANDDLFLVEGTRPISGKAFKAIQVPSTDDHWIDDSVMDHILGGWSRSYPTSRQSPWISTTASYRWAIWETARRLLSGQVSFVNVTTVNTYTK